MGGCLDMKRIKYVFDTLQYMGLDVEVRKYGRGHWIYIPKNIMELLDMPNKFDANVESSKLILTPKK